MYQLVSVSQVTVHYEQKDGAVIPKRVHTIVISVQHDDFISLEDQKKVLKEKVGQILNAAFVRKQTHSFDFNAESRLSGDQHCSSCSILG